MSGAPCQPLCRPAQHSDTVLPPVWAATYYLSSLALLPMLYTTLVCLSKSDPRPAIALQLQESLRLSIALHSSHFLSWLLQRFSHLSHSMLFLRSPNQCFALPLPVGAILLRRKSKHFFPSPMQIEPRLANPSQAKTILPFARASLCQSKPLHSYRSQRFSIALLTVPGLYRAAASQCTLRLSRAHRSIATPKRDFSIAVDSNRSIACA